MSINAIIVDDEEHSRKSLFFLIESYCPEIKVKGIARSVKEARAFLKSEHIDIVFLDIAMPNEDGFSLLPDLQQNITSVIFTTAYDQYAIKAIKASAVDYLLKPIDVEELKNSIVNVFKWKDLLQGQKSPQPGNTEWLNSLEENLNSIQKIRKINLPHANGFHVLNVNNILYVRADSNYSVFHLENKDRIIVSKHLKEYEEILENCGFNRIHKSTIINLQHLTDYSNKNGLTVRLSDGSEHTVSRRRSTDFLVTVKGLFKSDS